MDIYHPFVDTENPPRSIAWSLMSATTRMLWSPAANAFIVPAAWTPPTPGTVNPPAPPDTLIPLPRATGHASAQLCGVLVNVPEPAPHDAYMIVDTDMTTGLPVGMPWRVESDGPLKFSIAFSR